MARHDNPARQSKISSARRLIVDKGCLVDGTAVEALLKPESLVPTAVRILSLYAISVDSLDLQNAFSEKLGPLGFNLFLMFLVDLMHDFELGVWRFIFIHLLRILESVDVNLLTELDRR
jgi:hypothetical protein